MEGIAKGDDLVAWGALGVWLGGAELSGELDEAFIGFCSGVGEEDFSWGLDEVFDDRLCQLPLLGDLVEV